MDPPRPDGAYYLAGYAIECALKAAVARLNQHNDWPEKDFVNKCHTHDISALVRLAGLDAARLVDIASNRDLERNWIIVKDWSERGRYERHPFSRAQEFIDAITDPVNGVLPWIKAHW